MTPTTFGSEEEKQERMYQFPLEGYRKLKAFLIDSPGWAWIELHHMAENGRNDCLPSVDCPLQWRRRT
jgi:hypothetical protein